MSVQIRGEGADGIVVATKLGNAGGAREPDDPAEGVRGWMNYYGRFYRSRCVQVLRHLHEALGAWARRKYRRFRRRERASMHWLGRIARRERTLFAHWAHGVLPDAGS